MLCLWSATVQLQIQCHMWPNWFQCLLWLYRSCQCNCCIQSTLYWQWQSEVCWAVFLFPFSIPLIVFEEILEPIFLYLCPKISTFAKIVKMDMQFILELHTPNVWHIQIKEMFYWLPSAKNLQIFILILIRM